MEREQTGLSGLLKYCLGGTSCCLHACSEDEGEWKAATRVKGMASMRVTAKRAKGEYYTYVRSNISGRRSAHD